MLRVRRACVRPWCHTCQRHAAHEALHPLAIDPVPAAPQIHHHLAAAVEGMARVFLVDQALEQLVGLDKQHGFALDVDRRARNPSEHALALLRDIGMGVDPSMTDHGRLIPDFFLSQSSSIFKRPISP